MVSEASDLIIFRRRGYAAPKPPEQPAKPTPPAQAAAASTPAAQPAVTPPPAPLAPPAPAAMAPALQQGPAVQAPKAQTPQPVMPRSETPVSRPAPQPKAQILPPQPKYLGEPAPKPAIAPPAVQAQPKPAPAQPVQPIQPIARPQAQSSISQQPKPAPPAQQPQPYQHPAQAQPQPYQHPMSQQQPYQHPTQSQQKPQYPQKQPQPVAPQNNVNLPKINKPAAAEQPKQQKGFFNSVFGAKSQSQVAPKPQPKPAAPAVQPKPAPQPLQTAHPASQQPAQPVHPTAQQIKQQAQARAQAQAQAQAQQRQQSARMQERQVQQKPAAKQQVQQQAYAPARQKESAVELYCTNHPWRRAYARCTNCQLAYCYADLMYYNNKPYCLQDIDDAMKTDGISPQLDRPNNFSIGASFMLAANSVILGYFLYGQAEFLAAQFTKQGAESFILSSINSVYLVPIANILIIALGIVASLVIYKRSQYTFSFSFGFGFVALFIMLYEYLNNAQIYMALSSFLLLMSVTLMIYSRMSSFRDLQDQKINTTVEVNWPRPETF